MRIAVLSGLLLIDKPSGLTSHDVVLRVRRSLNISHIGPIFRSDILMNNCFPINYW